MHVKTKRSLKTESICNAVSSNFLKQIQVTHRWLREEPLSSTVHKEASEETAYCCYQCLQTKAGEVHADLSRRFSSQK